MSKAQYNPFTVGTPVRKKENFVGRSRELSSILSRLNSGNPISIVGRPRIGKSSLLYYLEAMGPDSFAKPTDWIYLSFHEPEMESQTDFSEYVLEKLGNREGIDSQQLEKKPLVILSKVLRERRKKHEAPVLLLDEFEKVTKSKDLFTDIFFETLREFCSDGRINLVTSTVNTLRDLTDEGHLTSKLWNIFTTITLGEFIMDDSLNEAHDFLQHFWLQDRLDGTESDWKWLYTFSDTHPLVLQIISSWVLRNRELQYNEKQLSKAIENDLTNFFRTKPELLGKWMKERSTILRKISLIATSEIGQHLKNLSPLSTLLGS